jgi:predicted RND superfamily exporter protein
MIHDNPATSGTPKHPSRVRRCLRAYIDFSEKWHVLVVVGSLLLASLGLWLCQKIHLDANLDSLLPRNTETIRAMKEARARFGSTDLYTIAIVMDNPDTIARIQDELKSTLEKKWPDIVYAQDSRDNTFFKQHALLYLPIPYLQQIQQKLEQTKLNLGMQGPLGSDLLDDEPAAHPAQLEWFNAQIPQQLGLPDEAADAFADFFKSSKAKDSTPQDFDPKAGLPDSLRSRLMGKTQDGRIVGLVQATLKYPSSDITYVKSVLARTQTLLAPFKARYGDKLQIGVEGPYKELEDTNSLARNGLIATVISVGLNILILLLFFRSLGAVFMIGMQAAIACALTLGVVALAYGHLNLYTVFVIAILFGMGTDFSIYILGYAQKLVRSGKTWKDALEKTLSGLFFSLLVHATTTIAGLLTLRVSRFVGFYEFSLIASIGVALSLLAAFLTLPSFIFLWERFHGYFPRVWPSLRPKKSFTSWITPALKGRDMKTLVSYSAAFVGLATVILACFVPRVRFEYDFDKLRDTRSSSEHNLPVSVALNSHRTSSQPVIVLAHDSATMVALHDTLLARLTVQKDPYLRSFLTLSTFVPPTDQQKERMEYIDSIGVLAQTRIFDRATGEDSVMIRTLRDLSHTHEFNSSDIPAWSLNLLRERDSSYGKIGFIYGNYNSSNAIDAGKFQDRYGHFDINGEHLSAFSSSFIFSDIIRIVKADSVKIFACMILVLVLLLGFILRDARLSLICAIEMAVGVICILGLMGLFRVKIGVFNLIVISDLQGYSVNICTYLLLEYLRLGKNRLRELYSNIGMLVAISTLTTTAGYAGMLFTSHLGIISIGKFAVLGLPTLLFTTLGLTPWLCMKLIPESRIRKA